MYACVHIVIIFNIIRLFSGPPGTGKTYIEHKIAKVFLANKYYWMADGRPCPILVVCYTNHALDQFLEGIYTFCKSDIARSGGRSKNETLEPFPLKNIKKKRRLEKKRSIGLLRSEKDCKMRLSASKLQIECERKVKIVFRHAYSDFRIKRSNTPMQHSVSPAENYLKVQREGSCYLAWFYNRVARRRTSFDGKFIHGGQTLQNMETDDCN